VEAVLKRNTAQKGSEGEAAVLHALVRNGYLVLIPWQHHLPYDLAIYVPEEVKMLRVQCKVGRLSADGSCVEFNSYIIVPGEGGRRSTRRGYKGDAEYFGVYCPKIEKVYLLPVDDVPCTGAKLRLLPSKNNQEKGVKWAKDYEL